MRLDLAGGLLGPLGELAYLGGDDREAAAVLAGPGRLDGGVEREQVGLVGEVVDHHEDAADLLALLAQRQGPVADRVDPSGDRVHRVDRRGHRDAAVLGVAQRLGGVPRDRLGGVGDLRRGRSQLLDRRGGLGDRGRLLGRARRVLLGRRQQLAGALRELVAAARGSGRRAAAGWRCVLLNEADSEAMRDVRLGTLLGGSERDGQVALGGAYERVGQLAHLGLELQAVLCARCSWSSTVVASWPLTRVMIGMVTSATLPMA
jgi:hypothetical protein